MMITPERLRALRAESDRTAAARTAEARAAADRVAQARELGRRLAADSLTWARVLVLLDDLPLAKGIYGPGLPWRQRRDAHAPEAAALGSLEEWTEFLGGVSAIAEMISPGIASTVPRIRLRSEL